jgi:hypothetical protein
LRRGKYYSLPGFELKCIDLTTPMLGNELPRDSNYIASASSVEARNDGSRSSGVTLADVWFVMVAVFVSKRC